MQSPLGQQLSFVYDDNGNIARRTAPDGRVTDYEYDAYNQLTGVYYGGQAAPVKTVTFTYDNAGNMLAWSDGASSGAYAYDGLNRVASETTTYPFGSRTISYTYDRFGNRQTAVYPGGMGTIAYGYDEFNRLTSMSYGASAVNYSYDPAGRLISKTLPNGVAASYTYDNANRLTGLVNRRGDTSVISSFSYTHDNVGNRLTMTEVSGAHSYSYDDIYRLLSAAHPAASTESYTYDRVGNRLTSATDPSWNYDQNNRLLSYDGVTYNYDDNGNRTSRTGSSLTDYSYDFENRLESVNFGFITYGYDPFGKRLAKTVGGVTTYYFYDGEDIIAEYDSTGALIAGYIHGPGVDEPIEMTRGGNTYFYSFDGLGSVRDLTDSGEAVAEQYDYDSFGNLTSPPATGNPYTYTSREYDPETGLLFYRARYYDPATGRFLTEDPIGFDGGDVNFYAYVAGNPVNFIDPMGLWFGVDDVLTGPADEILVIGALYAAYEANKANANTCSISTSRTDNKNNKGAYYRHYTSYEGLAGIKQSTEIWASLGGTYGAGVYLTRPGVPPFWLSQNLAKHTLMFGFQMQ